MKLALSPSNRCIVTAFSLTVGLLLGLPMVFGAVSSSAERGTRLLQAELPTRVTLLNADSEQLATAVGRATLPHQPEAAMILRAALTRGICSLPRGEKNLLPCACAERVFRVSVAAAPTQASALLDLATELYPACAAELAEALRDYDLVSYDYKDRVLDDKNGPVRVASGSPSDPLGSTQDPGDLSARDIDGLGLGDFSGFGSGFGPGFPGSPGFVGSAPDGGLALPPAPVTAAVNS